MAADDGARQAGAQRSELPQDQAIGWQVVTGLRIWFLVIMPLGLISTAFVHSLRPLWPYPAAWWASGPAAALLALRICRRPSRQAPGQMPGLLSRRLNIRMPMVLYTCRTIADVSGTTSVNLLIASAVSIAAYTGSSAGSAGARDAARAWHWLFGVLPAQVLAIAIWVVVSRMRLRDQDGAGTA